LRLKTKMSKTAPTSFFLASDGEREGRLRPTSNPTGMDRIGALRAGRGSNKGGCIEEGKLRAGSESRRMGSGRPP